MNLSTDTDLALVLPESGFVFELGSLYDRLEQLTDKRHARGKRYPLGLLLLLLMLAKLAGEDRPQGIAEWVRARLSDLLEWLPVTRESLPCANTYRTAVSQAVEPGELQQQISEFLGAQTGGTASVLVAFDGKTMRGTLHRDNPTGVHLLAAYHPQSGLVLAQVQVGAKTNEITAAPQVLKSLDLRGKVVMGDALHTQRAVSVQIVEQGGDYLWIAKDNQWRVRADIEQAFTPEVCGPGSSPQPTDWQTAQTVDKGHGRITLRTLTSSALLRDYLDWPGVAQVFKLERDVRTLANERLRHEVVYGLTSLTRAQAGPAELLAWVRQYWGIENGLHYRRDVSLNEDATRMKNSTAAQVWATLNNLVVGLRAHLPFASVPQARRHFAARPEDALDILTRRTL